MRVIVKSDDLAASEFVASLIRSQIQEKPDSVLGLPTGGTPLKIYAELIRMHREEGLDFSRISTFNLDEYLGIGADHPGSFHHYMQEHFVSKVNVDPARVHIPDGLSLDPIATCEAYEGKIRETGGIDLQVLGLGRDGHIAFNEPGSPLGSRTRVETLTAVTRQDNAGSFSGPQNVPEQAITMGIGTILEARRIVLVVFGRQKAEVVRKSITGPITTMVPASALQFHKQTLVVLDRAAACLLEGVGEDDTSDEPASLSPF